GPTAPWLGRRPGTSRAGCATPRPRRWERGREPVQAPEDGLPSGAAVPEAAAKAASPRPRAAEPAAEGPRVRSTVPGRPAGARAARSGFRSWSAWPEASAAAGWARPQAAEAPAY